MNKLKLLPLAIVPLIVLGVAHADTTTTTTIVSDKPISATTPQPVLTSEAQTETPPALSVPPSSLPEPTEPTPEPIVVTTPTVVAETEVLPEPQTEPEPVVVPDPQPITCHQQNPTTTVCVGRW